MPASDETEQAHKRLIDLFVQFVKELDGYYYAVSESTWHFHQDPKADPLGRSIDEAIKIMTQHGLIERRLNGSDPIS